MTEVYASSKDVNYVLCKIAVVCVDVSTWLVTARYFLHDLVLSWNDFGFVVFKAL